MVRKVFNNLLFRQGENIHIETYYSGDTSLNNNYVHTHTHCRHQFYNLDCRCGSTVWVCLWSHCSDGSVNQQQQTGIYFIIMSCFTRSQMFPGGGHWPRKSTGRLSRGQSGRAYPYTFSMGVPPPSGQMFWPRLGNLIILTVLYRKLQPTMISISAIQHSPKFIPLELEFQVECQT